MTGNRRIAIIASAAVFAAAAFAALVLPTDAVQLLNRYLQATDGTLQAKRAITVSEATAEGLDRVDLVLAVDAKTLTALVPLLTSRLNDSTIAKQQRLTAGQPTVEFGPQRLTLEVPLTRQVDDDVVVRLLAQVSAAVGATATALHWNLYADGFQVTRVEGLDRTSTEVISAIGRDIDGLLPILNAVLDDAVNDDPDKAVLVSLNDKSLIDERLEESSTDALRFDAKRLVTALDTQAAAVVIDRSGILVAAKVEFVPPEAVDETPPSFPSAAELVRQDADGIAPRIAAYQKRVRDAVLAASADFKPFVELKQAGLAASKPALARLVNFNFAQGPVSGTYTANQPVDMPPKDLTLQIQEKNCHQYFAGCDYKPICEGDRCEQKVTKKISQTCKVSCCLSWGGLFGGICLLTGSCDKACDKVIDVLEPISSPACDGFRTADTLYGGALCSIASNVDKAVCDVEANVKKAACDVQQEVRRFYEKNPVATLSASMHPDASLALSVANGSMTEDLSRFTVDASASGGGKLKAYLGYDRHNYADAAVLGSAVSFGLLCATDWSESIDLDVTAENFNARLAFDVAAAQDGNNLVFTFTQAGTETAYVDFSPPPLVALFGGKPQVTLNCPLMAVASVLFSSAEGAFTDADARQAFPLLTGDDYPVKLEGKQFKLKLPPTTLCDKLGDPDCEAPLLTLYPRVAGGVVSFVPGPQGPS